ncbi:MAG: Rieske (2Fe-2S) protein [Nocardioides sp.]
MTLTRTTHLLKDDAMTDSISQSEVPDGTVTGAGGFAVGNKGGDYFAVSRRCRHLGADLAGGSISADGCLVCPWHQSEYDVTTGHMVKGPQGIFAKVPGLGAMFMGLSRVLPLRRRHVVRDGANLRLDS